MNKYIVSEETLNSILNYLGSRPYVEVMDLVDSIRTAEAHPDNVMSVLTEESEEEGEELSHTTSL